MSSQVNMRGPWLKTPLLFLLLLISSLTGTAFCQEEHETGGTLAPEPTKTVETASAEFYSTPTENTSEPDTASGSGDFDVQAVSSQDVSGTTVPPEEPDYTTYILIAVVAVVVIAGAIICGIVIMHRHRQKGGNQELSKVDPVLDGSSTEKVPMPMFEEDVPSVLELEMDELDQWMKKDS